MIFIVLLKYYLPACFLLTVDSQDAEKVTRRSQKRHEGPMSAIQVTQPSHECHRSHIYHIGPKEVTHTSEVRESSQRNHRSHERNKDHPKKGDTSRSSHYSHPYCHHIRYNILEVTKTSHTSGNLQHEALGTISQAISETSEPQSTIFSTCRYVHC